MVDVPREKKPRRRLTAVASVATLVVAGTLGFCHFKPAAPRVSRQSLYIDTVRTGAMVVEVRGAGTLVPEDMQWIPVATAGRVERVLVQPGDEVGPDALLLELSNPEAEQTARDAELQVRAAEAELRGRRLQIRSQILAQEAVVAAARVEHEDARDRARADAELAQAGLTSSLTLQASRGREKQTGVRASVEEKRFALAQQSEETELAVAESRVDQLRAVLMLRRQQLAALQVRAGRRGVVQQVAAEVGARVNAGTNLVRVAAREPLKAVIQISQVEASQIALGQRVRIDTHQGIVSGVIARIDPTVQNGSVNIDVRLPPQLPAGMRSDLSVDAAVEIDRVENAIHVNRPVQAGPQTTIALFRLTGDRAATRVPVRIGRTSFNAVEILGGLKAGDRVILSDTSAYDDFEQITITD